jgi:hypothetical protein
MEKRDLFKETKDFTEKAKQLKSEFEILPYSDRLKLMDKEFKGASAIYEGEGRGEEPILSVWPSEEEQIRLYNEWKIKLFESLEPTLSLDFSFERLKKKFDDHISKVKRENPHSESIINQHTQDEIKLYREKILSTDIQLVWKEFGGAWDITKKVINNLGAFLKARAFYNYISFLESQPDKLTNTKEPIIKREYISLIYEGFKEWFSEPLEQWNERFIYPNGKAIEPIEIDSKVNRKSLNDSNRVVLLGILSAIEKANGNRFDFNEFALNRFGIKGYKTAKGNHKTKELFRKSESKCNAILKK